MSTSNALLLYHPCTGAQCSHQKSPMVLGRELKLQKRLTCQRRDSLWKPKKRFSVSCSSAVPGTEAKEPTIDEMLTQLEQGGGGEPKKRPPLTRSRTFTVQESELVAGKVLPGKVKSIMPFGAFIDMGARIDGLLHISKLSDGFVQSVEEVVKVGQEIQVQILEADIANRRVSLKMYDPTKPSTPARTSSTSAARSSSTSAGAAGGTREAFRGKVAGRGAPQGNRTTAKPKSNYQKGQEVTGVVKNLTRRGCFVQLPGDEEGFLHANEISDIGETAPIDTLVKVGQEVKVKVIRIVEGRLNLTMKEELDLQKVNEQFNENLVATNPFELAFRKSAVLRKYLEETGKLPTEESKEIVAKKKSQEADELVEKAEGEEEKRNEDAVGAEALTATEEDSITEAAADLAPEEKKPDGEASEVTAEATEEAEHDKDEHVEAEALTATEEQSSTEAAADHTPEEKKLDGEASEIKAEATEEAEHKDEQPVEARNVEQPENTQETANEPKEGTAALSEAEPVPELKEDAKQVKDNGVPTSSEAAPSQTGISAALVKQLREQSGAGMMDCKKALMETGGDMTMAIEYLRKKGLAGADKKASRIAAEGAIGSYVHDSRIGVLLEVNSETDFVARGDIFKQLVEDLGMQIAASQQVDYVSIDDVPAEMKSKEMELEMQREDLQSKPEAIRGKIVEGRVAKRLSEMALLEQPFIKNDSILVKDLVKQTIAAVGEKIQVRRFTRYVLGEGLEKRSHDLAAEVAAQTKAQEAKENAPQAEEKKDEISAAAKEEKNDGTATAVVAISAGLVKQLREETGAGMMDCKKALTETQGDLEKARDYLRKKGLAGAEKKAGRVAAEGLVVSYIHAGRIGVLLELNCETDFVARNSVFKELADDLAMQAVACPQVDYVSVDDVPEEVKQKERDIEMQREDLLSKPEQIRGKIVEGRLAKLFAEKALLEQPYLKNDSVVIKDLVKQTTASLGENVKVRRFVRYTLGEGIEKKSQSFAEEVAAQVNSS